MKLITLIVLGCVALAAGITCKVVGRTDSASANASANEFIKKLPGRAAPWVILILFALEIHPGPVLTG